MAIVYCMVPEMWSTTDKVFCHFGPFFALFLPRPSNSENQNFEKLKKTPGDIIILHMYTIIDNHVMYGSWNMECDGHFVLSFWTIFCPFNPSPLTTQKLKIKKKNEKSTWRYHHSTHLYQILWPHDARLLRYGVRRTDGQTDGRRKGRKKWHIEASGPPKKRDF